MIPQETLHHDQDTADLQATHALLADQAESLVHSWHFSQRPFGKAASRRYWKGVKTQERALLTRAESPPDEGPFDTRPPDQRNQIIREHKRLLTGAFKEVAESWDSFAKLPEAWLDGGETQPRAFLLVDKFLAVTEERWTRETWAFYLRAIERHEPLLVREIWSSVAVLKLLLLQRFCYNSSLPSETNQQQNAGSTLQHMQSCVQSLERLGEVEWNRFLEPLVPFDRILRLDPAGAYAGMELASRQLFTVRLSGLLNVPTCQRCRWRRLLSRWPKKRKKAAERSRVRSTSAITCWTTG